MAQNVNPVPQAISIAYNNPSVIINTSLSIRESVYYAIFNKF